jgi:hypothetical protein
MTLEENDDQAELMKSFKGATRALKNSMVGSGARVDQYDDMTDELGDAQEMMGELNQAMTGQNNDSAFEDELDELFEEEPATKRRQSTTPRDPPPTMIDDSTLVESLPKVPTGTIKQEIEKELIAVTV